jgi:UPF0716 protein FxsA
MVVPLFWMYVLVEVVAVVALGWTVGLGWTLLILLATFVVGLSVAGSQIKRQLRRLREGMTTAHGAVSDGAVVALGALLVVIPGLVTTVLGLLLLLPPTRAAARPVLTFLAVRGVGRRVPLITVASMGASRRFGGRADYDDYIDGEVVDTALVEPPALPDKPA